MRLLEDKDESKHMRKVCVSQGHKKAPRHGGDLPGRLPLEGDRGAVNLDQVEELRKRKIGAFLVREVPRISGIKL